MARKELKQQKAGHQEKLKHLKAYIQELESRCESYGTDHTHFDGDLMKAQNDAQYYEACIE